MPPCPRHGRGHPQRAERWPIHVTAAGGINTSIASFANWLRLHLDKGEFEGQRLLPPTLIFVAQLEVDQQACKAPRRPDTAMISRTMPVITSIPATPGFRLLFLADNALAMAVRSFAASASKAIFMQRAWSPKTAKSLADNIVQKCSSAARLPN
jgi:CubicO group peptidase (beta-lactamase class C family)